MTYSGSELFTDMNSFACVWRPLCKILAALQCYGRLRIQISMQLAATHAIFMAV